MMCVEKREGKMTMMYILLLPPPSHTLSLPGMLPGFDAHMLQTRRQKKRKKERVPLLVFSLSSAAFVAAAVGAPRPA
jgi:hypothetical protein